MGDENQKLSDISELTKSLKRHEEALQALKDVPAILNKLVGQSGVTPTATQPKTISDWSLGLSDEDNDELGHDADNIIGNDAHLNDELQDLLQDTEKTTEFGPSLLPNVSSGFVKTAVRPLSKESKNSLKNKMKIPENCKEFLVPKVNVEIWKLLPSQAKIVDIKSQQTQEVLSSGLLSLASITNTLAMKKDQIPKDVMSSVVQQSIDCANMLGDHFQSINGRRRYEMKKFLNPEYSGICNAQIPCSEWLFGSDLAENLKSTKATASLMKNTMTKNFRYNPYPRVQPQQTYGPTNSLNRNRPLFHPAGPSGQYQQRFERRPQTQLRMTGPSLGKYQQRFKKY